MHNRYVKLAQFEKVCYNTFGKCKRGCYAPSLRYVSEMSCSSCVREIVMMKRIGGIILIMLCCMTLFGGCGKETEETITNKKIPLADVTEFYYTCENINFDAFFQRYRFYREDGKYMFQHETREKPGEYGPTSEEDITGRGTFELTEEEWNEFLTFLKDGTVSARKDSGESGGAGPWTFIYWKNDKGKYQVFEFATYDARTRFEEYCSSLAQEVNMREIKIRRISYNPGYGDMLGGYHEETLRKDKDGSWTYVCCDREDYRAPTVTTVYGVSPEAVEQFEEFISEKKILSLEDRPKSDIFATDYRPWSWYIDYEEKSFGEIKQGYFSIEQYREYSDKDYELLKDLCERFTALRGEKLSETVEESDF